MYPVNTSTGSLKIPRREDGWIPNISLLSETPSGQHLWAMTPGGTRLTWTRDQLMHLANSPLSKSPLDLPAEVLFLGRGAPKLESTDSNDEEEDTEITNSGTHNVGNDDALFHMDS
eukprot:TRINITY_DN1137_c0_g1_i2.p1 TRINITY_DN1137_c0_g1~~TRINITY_DN1137_c0_g1_i2.p1  ORF type:complete len:116 (-),score=11.72 TRINITY_DN1137_c0_g1_i2:96-443(-)